MGKKLILVSIIITSLQVVGGATKAEQPMRRWGDPAGVMHGASIPIPMYPTDRDVFDLHLFPEPLVPAESTRPNSAEENAELAVALKAYQSASLPRSLDVLNAYVKEHPGSRWNVALLTNVGLLYLRNGYFSRAMDAWSNAWELSAAVENPAVRRVAERALSELALMKARIGRGDELEAIFAQVKGRRLTGSAAAAMACAAEGYQNIKNRPGISFQCGPYALDTIRRELKRPISDDFIRTAPSPPGGFNLEQVEVMATGLGLDYQMARRTPGSEVIVPAVVHWKMGHFSALPRRKGDRYLVRDPTFGISLTVSKDALDEEASGYFLARLSLFAGRNGEFSNEIGSERS